MTMEHIGDTARRALVGTPREAIPPVRGVPGRRGIMPCPEWTPTEESPGRNSTGKLFLFHWEYDWFIPETYEAYLDSGWVAFMLAERKRTWRKRGDAYWSPAWRSDWEQALKSDNAAYLNGRIGYGPQQATPEQQEQEGKRMSLEAFRGVFEEVWFSFYNSPPRDEKVAAYYQHLGGVEVATLERRAARIVKSRGRFPSVAEWLGNDAVQT